ncbi:hypothetical protein BGW37DRAFT_468063 [Umbelopsis sp. PMI_123]|nr:hypothetical protein BGW37DRAFT_468063 [Umbelopsis sp. PMI_123]
MTLLAGRSFRDDSDYAYVLGGLIFTGSAGTVSNAISAEREYEAAITSTICFASVQTLITHKYSISVMAKTGAVTMRATALVAGLYLPYKTHEYNKDAQLTQYWVEYNKVLEQYEGPADPRILLLWKKPNSTTDI